MEKGNKDTWIYLRSCSKKALEETKHALREDRLRNMQAGIYFGYKITKNHHSLWGILGKPYEIFVYNPYAKFKM